MSDLVHNKTAAYSEYNRNNSKESMGTNIIDSDLFH